MTDLEFVQGVIDSDGSNCAGMVCSHCPFDSDNNDCLDDDILLTKAKAWLENYKKEHKMEGIKVTVTEKAVEKKSEYPCFKISTADSYPPKEVVFFTEKSTGYCVTGNDVHAHKYFSDCWCEYRFIPFHGKIEIEVE